MNVPRRIFDLAEVATEMIELMPDPRDLAEILGVAEGTPMSVLTKALAARDSAQEVGSMLRSSEDFLVPVRVRKKRSEKNK